MAKSIHGRPGRQLPGVTDEVLRGSPRRIIEYGEAILHRPCQTVHEFGADRWADVIDDMFTTMWIAEGCGLAANQVGIDARLFVYDLIDEHGDRHHGHMFNPRIMSLAGLAGEQTGSEGCLSIPGAAEQVTRPVRVIVQGFDLAGQPIQVQGTNYFARCLMHETQHLDGVLYLDHLSPAARQRAVSRSAAMRTTIHAQRLARQRQLDQWNR